MVKNHDKKILYVITRSNWGGAQRYVFDLVTNLPAGWEGVVAFGGNGILNEKLASAEIRTINILRLGRDISLFGDIAVFFSLIRVFLRERPSVVHLNSSKIGGLGALAGRVYNGIQKIKSSWTKNSRLKTRIIFTAHGWAFNEPRNFVSKIIIRLLSWFTVVFSHKIIAVSEKDYKQAKQMLFSNGKIYLVHNGVSKTQFIERNKAREILLGSKASKLGGDVVWVGIIAELTKNKGVEYAVEATEKFRRGENRGGGVGGAAPKAPPIVLVVIGDGENKFKLANMIKNKKLERKIFLVGVRDNASSLLKAFDIFMLPSLKEGLPYVLLEAGVAKLPVVASGVGGVPEIIDDMKSGILMRPREPEEIYKALMFLIKNKNKMKEFGSFLHEEVVTKFSSDRMMRETIRVYVK